MRYKYTVLGKLSVSFPIEEGSLNFDQEIWGNPQTCLRLEGRLPLQGTDLGLFRGDSCAGQALLRHHPGLLAL